MPAGIGLQTKLHWCLHLRIASETTVVSGLGMAVSCDEYKLAPKCTLSTGSAYPRVQTGKEHCVPLLRLTATVASQTLQDPIKTTVSSRFLIPRT